MRSDAWRLAAALLCVPPIPAAAQAPAPTTFEATAAAAAQARDAGRLEDALALYQRAVRSRPDWDEGTWYVGSLLYELGRHAPAREAFTALIARQPDHAGAVAMAALCDFSLGRYDESLRGLLRARTLGISRTPDVATVVRYHAGILLTRFGDFELGMSILAEPGQDVSESPPMITAFGLNTLRRPVLPSEMSANERPMVELAGRATLAAVARRASEARAAFDELVAHYPQVSHVHYARGVFLLSSEPDLAIADFERELGVTPNHLLARVQIAFEQLRRGEFDRARPYAVAAVRLDAKHPVARLALGQVELEAGSVDAAVTELETAVRLAPESAQAHFVLARAYARAGRTADAERERKEFARLDRVARPR